MGSGGGYPLEVLLSLEDSWSVEVKVKRTSVTLRNIADKWKKSFIKEGRKAWLSELQLQEANQSFGKNIFSWNIEAAEIEFHTYLLGDIFSLTATLGLYQYTGITVHLVSVHTNRYLCHRRNTINTVTKQSSVKTKKQTVKLLSGRLEPILRVVCNFKYFEKRCWNTLRRNCKPSCPCRGSSWISSTKLTILPCIDCTVAYLLGISWIFMTFATQVIVIVFFF